MKILFVSDSFKGSMSSKRIAELLDDAVREVFPEAETEKVLVADGGEGTMDTVLEELHGTYRKIKVKGPLGEERRAGYGILPGGKAMIEMAAASVFRWFRKTEESAENHQLRNRDADCGRSGSGNP